MNLFRLLPPGLGARFRAIPCLLGLGASALVLGGGRRSLCQDHACTVVVLGVPDANVQAIRSAILTRVASKGDLAPSRVVVERVADRGVVIRVQRPGGEVTRHIDDIEDSLLPDVAALVVAMSPIPAVTEPQPETAPDHRSDAPSALPILPIVPTPSPGQERPPQRAKLPRSGPSWDRLRLAWGYEAASALRNSLREHRASFTAEYSALPWLGVVSAAGLSFVPFEAQTSEVSLQVRRYPLRLGPRVSWPLRGVWIRLSVLGEVALVSERIDPQEPGFTARADKRHVEAGIAPRAELDVPVDRSLSFAAGVGLGMRLVGSRWAADLPDGRRTILDPGILLPEAYVAVKLGLL